MGAEARRKIQKSLLERKENITIHEGNSPVPLELLLSMDKNSPCVESVIDGGLTAIIYKFSYEGHVYCLKKKRANILVKNEDGQLSFLNEILCRKTIVTHEKNPILAMGISKTHFASLHDGIILTDWVNGQHPRTFNRTRFKLTFELLLELEKIGLFEWDLCIGNLLYVVDQPVLFDFGYMYQTDIFKGPNSEGMSAILFNSIERFETRAFMPFLLDLQLGDHIDEVYHLYRMEKEESILAFEARIDYLERKKVDLSQITYYKKYIHLWSEGIDNFKALKELYVRESMRSYALDIHDDLSGHSCTPHTIKKIDQMIFYLPSMYSTISRYNEWLWFDKGKSLETLIQTYTKRRESAILYQIEPQM